MSNSYDLACILARLYCVLVVNNHSKTGARTRFITTKKIALTNDCKCKQKRREGDRGALSLLHSSDFVVCCGVLVFSITRLLSHSEIKDHSKDSGKFFMFYSFSILKLNSFNFFWKPLARNSSVYLYYRTGRTTEPCIS